MKEKERPRNEERKTKREEMIPPNDEERESWMTDETTKP
jgi:hypothetical protein